MFDWLKYFMIWLIWTICFIISPLTCLMWTSIGLILGYIVNRLYQRHLYNLYKIYQKEIGE